ncbi:MAG: beta-ketoacyl synthase N-terminal-like domain-containing protein [Candidatus Omnitrophica bacterium]|nr:beta-ketoacyl synthase N-terminal-like domain-containing protein [Candidatus Omnitrophota bacterium]
MAGSKRIVITGLGPFSAIGTGKDDVWDSVLRKYTGLTQEEFVLDGKLVDKYFVHKIKEFNIEKFGIDKQILEDILRWKDRREPQDLFYLMAAAKLALDDGRINIDRNRIGLVLAHENPGLDEFYADLINEFYKLRQEDKTGFFKGINEGFAKRGHDLQTFVFLYFVAKALDIHGYSLFINNACASGLFAVETGADIIRSGKCDCVIVAASDKSSIFKQSWFRRLEMYPEDGLIKPFAKNRDGFVLGDGGAGIMLESLDSALKRKAHIYAEYLGGAFHMEAWKISIPDMGGNSYSTVIESALKNSAVNRKSIDLLVPHGVATPVTDAYEAKAITDVFGKNPKKPLITALKPYIGHNLGSTALLETVILLLSLENNTIPPTLNCQIPDAKLNISPVRDLIKTKLNTVMKTACGFAGYNGAAVFGKL